MLFNTYIRSQIELEQIQQSSVNEVILEHKSLSRLGKLDTKTLITILDAALSAGMSPVLQWDILSTEQTFQHSISLLNSLPLAKFYAIRVQDHGAAEWFRQENPEIPIHLIVETGNQNLKGLQAENLKDWRRRKFLGNQGKEIAEEESTSPVGSTWMVGQMKTPMPHTRKRSRIAERDDSSQERHHHQKKSDNHHGDYCPTKICENGV